MSENRLVKVVTKSERRKTIGLFLLPIALLGVVIALFVLTKGAGLNVEPVAPIESLQFEQTTLKPGSIALDIRNTSPQTIEIAQVAVKDMIVSFSMTPNRVVPRLGQARVIIAYPWVEAEAYEVHLFTSNSAIISTAIEVAAPTRRADSASFWGFTLIGLYVGVIPVFLGLFWLPALRRLGTGVFNWLMAFTIGLLIFIGFDAGNEALQIAGQLDGPFQGIGLVVIGSIGTFMVLYAMGRRQPRPGNGIDEAAKSRRMALMISLGIGLHNLGEGLAIGSAYSIGAAALGTFFVIGFILQNITEGLGIIAPIIRQKPRPLFLVGLGLLGGAPAILGAWIGGFNSTPSLAAMFLAVGIGAVFEVAWEIALLMKKAAEKAPRYLSLSSGVLGGMLILWVTGLFVK